MLGISRLAAEITTALQQCDECLVVAEGRHQGDSLTLALSHRERVGSAGLPSRRKGGKRWSHSVAGIRQPPLAWAAWWRGAL
jgi:hypothetical protein